MGGKGMITKLDYVLLKRTFHLGGKVCFFKVLPLLKRLKKKVRVGGE